MAITNGLDSLSAKAPACMARAKSSLGFSARTCESSDLTNARRLSIDQPP
ncbi:MAG: hypothetical protein IPQ09_18650 [Myxococcales bacterium]|nr:hypothetical protein [Myxococcales bacterium]